MTEEKPQHFGFMFLRYNDSQQNMTNNGTDLFDEHNPPKYLFQMELALALVGVLLNICHGFALIYMRMRKPWTTHSKLIVSLAIADFIIASLHFVQHYESFPTIFSTGSVLNVSSTKVFISAVYHIAQFAQMLTMNGFAVSLVIATKLPLNYKRLMSPYRGNILVGCFWFVSVLFVGGVHMFTNILTEMNAADKACTVIIVLMITFSTLSPILLIDLFLSSFYDIYKLKRLSPRYLLLKRSALTFFVILLTYIVFLLPKTWLFAVLLYLYSTDTSLHYATYFKVTLTLSCLYVLNTICDPLIYAVRIEDIRDSYKSVYRKICAQRKSGSQAENM